MERAKHRCQQQNQCSECSKALNVLKVEQDEPLDFLKYQLTEEMETLDLEKLKMKNQSKGLKYGDGILEQVERPFPLRTSSPSVATLPSVLTTITPQCGIRGSHEDQDIIDDFILFIDTSLNVNENISLISANSKHIQKEVNVLEHEPNLMHKYGDIISYL